MVFYDLKIVIVARKLGLGQRYYGTVFRLPASEKIFLFFKRSRLGLGPHSLPLNGYCGLSIRS